MRLTQQQIADKTGLKQQNVSRALKQIKDLSFIPSQIRKVIGVLGWKVEINKGE